MTALCPVVFPIHPRTRQRFQDFGLRERLHAIEALQLLEPLGYLDFLRLMENAAVVVTDSGGIQEETTFLNVPCLTLRENTERPVTISLGTNELMSLEPDRIALRVADLLEDEQATGQRMAHRKGAGANSGCSRGRPIVRIHSALCEKYVASNNYYVVNPGFEVGFAHNLSIERLGADTRLTTRTNAYRKKRARPAPTGRAGIIGLHTRQPSIPTTGQSYEKTEDQ